MSTMTGRPHTKRNAVRLADAQLRQDAVTDDPRAQAKLARRKARDDGEEKRRLAHWTRMYMIKLNSDTKIALMRAQHEKEMAAAEAARAKTRRSCALLSMVSAMSISPTFNGRLGSMCELFVTANRASGLLDLAASCTAQCGGSSSCVAVFNTLLVEMVALSATTTVVTRRSSVCDLRVHLPETTESVSW